MNNSKKNLDDVKQSSSLAFLSIEPAISLIHLLLGVFHLEPINV